MARATEEKAERIVYHVVPDASAEKWLVTQENGSHRTEHATKEEAVKEARKLAQKGPLGQIKVHRKDGNMEYESTYGDDPRRSPG